MTNYIFGLFIESFLLISTVLAFIARNYKINVIFKNYVLKRDLNLFEDECINNLVYEIEYAVSHF